MRDFVNETDEGNEPAIRRGKVVPPNGINVAWAKSPRLSPDKNISIVDFSQLIPENLRNEDQRSRCRIMYANHLGILIDEYNNDVVYDEFPAVTDVFSIDEDFGTNVNIDTDDNFFQVEYKSHHILPYLHVSRYFHVDNAGLTMPGTPVGPPSNSILKVMHEDGTEYLNEEGEKAYRIELVYVDLEYAENEDPQDINNSALYRVNAYLDTEDAEGLFLQYFKAVYDSETKRVKEYQINYRERLNPFKFFSYVPEEAELVDQNYVEYKQYSTKSTGGKAQIYGGSPDADLNGYRIHVPKRAVPDSRIYQLFRWRIRCEFIDTHVTEDRSGGGWEAPRNPDTPITTPTNPTPVKPKIKAGILYHSDGILTSTAPMAFLNLSQSNVNMHGIEFINPLSEAAGRSRFTKNYWLVDMATTTKEMMSQFDILIMAPWLKKWTLLDSWYAYLIEHFVKVSGGTLVVDGGNDTYFTNSPFTQYSAPVMPSGNLYTSYGGSLSRANGASLYWSGSDGANHPIIKGNSRLAGHNLNTGVVSDVPKLTMRTQGYFGSTSLQYFGPNAITHIPGASWAAWRPILVAPILGGGSGSGVVLAATNGGGISNGSVIWCSIGLTDEVSRYYTSSGSLNFDAASFHPNNPPSMSQIQSAIATDINRSFLANAYKLLYNIALYAVRNKSVSLINTSGGNLGVNQSGTGAPVGGGYTPPEVEEGEFSTTWTAFTQWRPSYTIDGDVLTEQERDELGFTLAPYAEDSADVVWQRRLSNKTLHQLVDEEIGPELVARLASATRTYHIDVSNEAVKVPTTVLQGSNAPYAYTNAYSPPFIVPENLGPHVIKGEEFEEEYTPDTGTSAVYPPRPYKYRVDADIPKVDVADPQTSTITVTGIAVKTTETETPTHSDQTYMTWASHGENSVDIRSDIFNIPHPRGIQTWQSSNWGRTTLGNGSENWINPGLWDNAQASGPHNPITVKYLQKCMNLFKFWQITSHTSNLVEDGIFGPTTKAVLNAFQTKFQTKERDGIVNMETIGMISAQVLRMHHNMHALGSSFPTSWGSDTSFRFIYDTPGKCHLRNISDGNSNTIWLKTTKVNSPSNTPRSAWDFVALRIPGTHEINAVSLTAVTRLPVPDILLNSIHVTTTTSHNNLITLMHNYNGSAAQMKNMGRRCPNNAAVKIPIGPITGNTVIIGIGQDKPWGNIGAYIFGLREFGIWSASTRGGVTNTQTTTENISYTETVTVQPGEPPVFINAQLQSNPSLYSSVTWNNIQSSNPLVSAVVVDTVAGKVEVKNTDVDVYNEIHQEGKVYPDSFVAPNLGYSMNKIGNVSAFPESGFISKADGLKLFCDSQGKPNWEMPIPTATSELEADIQKHTEYTLVPLTSDPMVTIGFYDKVRNSFLFGTNGRSRITLEELDARGRDNIYVAAASAYQEMKEMELPNADPAKLPYKWAMPVYGVCERLSTRIGIEPISPGLGKLDIWPVGIRTGKFSREIYIRDNIEGPLTDWIADYRGKTVRAFYSVPEMNRAGWSPLLGRPYIDIIDEVPIIIDSHKIKVRQAPIAMEHETIRNGGVSRPARPFMSVYTRASAADEWQLVPWEDILDYKVSSGTVVLKKIIPGGQTEENVKISYSTKTDIYPFKSSEGRRINLNPYSSVEESYVNKPNYIYIVPKIVMGPDGEIIIESVQTNTLRYTNDSTIFNLTHPEYNPLAIPLGVVYVNNGSDIERLILLDTRRKGGGVSEELTLADAFSDYPESVNHWDVSPGAGLAYQNGGFMIIRLPNELKEQFSEENATEEIKSIITRRLPAGVSFKLENLDGTPWED